MVPAASAMKKYVFPCGLALQLFGASPAFAEPKPVVAVFDLENGAKLKGADVLSLTGYLSTRLAEGGRYRIVPKGEVQSALRAKKSESYQSCYDESCQIEIGRELAAQKTLSSKVSQLGSTCIVTVQLYDLAQGASEAAGTSKGGCKVEQILGLLDEALAPLVQPSAPQSVRGPTPEPARAQPAPSAAPNPAPNSEAFAPLPPELAERPMPELPKDLEALDAQVRALPFMSSSKARTLLVVEIQGLERLLRNTPASSPDYARLLKRTAEGYGELEFAAKREKASAGPKAEAIELAARKKHIEHLSHLVKDVPTDPQVDEALWTLALAQERAGDRSSARKIFFDLVKDHPKSRRVPYVYLGFGEFFFREGKQPLAQQSFLEAAKYPSVAAYAHYCAAWTAVLSGDRIAALTQLQKARELAPGLAADLPWKATLVAAIDRALKP